MSNRKPRCTTNVRAGATLLTSIGGTLETFIPDERSPAYNALPTEDKTKITAFSNYMQRLHVFLSSNPTAQEPANAPSPLESSTATEGPQ